MGRIALVTGGTRGIGAATAVALQKAGHKVAVTYNGNDEAAKGFEQLNGIKTFKWDVSDYEACDEGIQRICTDFGNPEILVNNAGITRDSMFHKMTYDQWQAVIMTNLTSCFNMTHCVIGSMREQGFGRIINISSVNGQKGQLGQTNYSAAKAGILGFTKALAQENANKGITVNAIAPGYIGTEMVRAIREDILSKIVAQIPVGRLGKPEEIADIVTFLASDNAAFITGATISANGGQYFS